MLEAVSKILGMTGYPGLTGSEVDGMLADAHAPDVSPGATKWVRVHDALAERQNKTQCSNSGIVAVTWACAPGRHVANPQRFHELRDLLNEPLALAGLRVNDAGKVAVARQATTLDEVAALAGRLTSELKRRQTHPEVTRYCREELLRQSTFHAVFEATKGLAQRLRDTSGSPSDGAALVDACFAAGSGGPVLTINAYVTESELSEHKGFANLIKGLFGTFRNPLAHAPRQEWVVTELDALDLFSLLSYVHRRLDRSGVSI